MKKIVLCLCAVLCLFRLAACRQAVPVYTAEDAAGKTYTYEKEGCGGTFAINLFEDGTFQYYEGMLSSYIGMGTWTLEEDNVLCMKDQEMGRFSDDFSTMEMWVRTNYFKVEEDCLVWIAERSDNFLYVDVVDGDRFFGEPFPSVPTLEELRESILQQNTSAVLKSPMDEMKTFTCGDLVKVWGEPDSLTSGIWSYGWDVDETCAVWVVFDSDGYVSEVHLKLKD